MVGMLLWSESWYFFLQVVFC